MNAINQIAPVEPMTQIDDIVSAFEFLGNWDQRYQYLTELGEKMPAMPKDLQVDDNRVKACMSKVWLYAYRDENSPELIRYYGECDTSIIKGIVALLVKLCSGKTPREVVDMDLDSLFTRLSLDQHLSPNRHVGVYAIVKVMKEQAQALLG